MQPPKKVWSLRSRAVRAALYQLIAVVIIGMLVYFLASNTLSNMQQRGIQSGFDFLQSAAGFDIGESLFEFDSGEPYWRAFLVGMTNTLRVAVLGIILTTLLGTLIGVGRFSKNALVRSLCWSYVEVFRNVPLLLQLLMWYLLFTELLPSPSEPLRWGSVFLSKGGLNFPIPVWSEAHRWTVGGLLAGGGVALVYRYWLRMAAKRSGRVPQQRLPFGVIVFIGLLVGWLLGGAPASINTPFQGEFAVESGAVLSPEFLSLLFGLTVYTAAFVAEVVRAGVQSVAAGQTEAAQALGLDQRQTLRLVVLPQALRVIIPPMTNQYLNLTKNSSLAVAIGYPDIVSIANTALNQSGRAVECISIIMLVYLCTSLATSLLMNIYNQRAALKER